MNIPADLLYSPSHEWLKLEGNVGTVGITDHAQHELSDVVYVDLPKVGATIQAKQTAAVVESVKAASDIYSPVSGEILEVNPALQADPSLVNNDPYGQGWMFKIRLSNTAESESLLRATAYGQQIGA